MHSSRNSRKIRLWGQCYTVRRLVAVNTIGVQGIMSAYQMCLQHVVLYGPTNFAPIIYHVAQFAAASKSEPTPKVWNQFSRYRCMFILTVCLCGQPDTLH